MILYYCIAMKNLNFIKTNQYLLLYGFLLSFFSSFGQTFLISLYLPSIQENFDLSDGYFSTIYASATIFSALVLSWLGRFIDKVHIIKFTIFVMIGLMVSLILFSQAYHLLILFLAFFGVRLFGQGLLTHTAITSMARFFELNRGKAISLAALGHPGGELILPFLVVSLIYTFGWRYTALMTSILVLLSIPLLIYLLRKNINFKQLRKYIPQRFTSEETLQAKPLKIIKSKAFLIIIPSNIVSASFGTGFLLFKLKLGLTFGWSPTSIAVGFMAYAFGNALANLLGGYMADKFSGKQLFPLYLLPSVIGFIGLMFFDDFWVYLLLVGSIGLTNGFGGTIKNVALAEIYGTKIIGSVRSLFVTITVFSTALGPLIFGFLLDYQYSFQQIALLSVIVYILMTMNSIRILKK